MLWPIIQWMNTLSSFFYSVYLEVNGWIWPFYKAAGLFYSISSVFASLGWDISNFGNWVTSVTSQLLTFINWSTLTSWFNQYVNLITTAFNWVSNWWFYVTTAINSWWQAQSATVLSWIADAKNWSTSQINTLRATILALISDLSAWSTAQINSFTNTILTIFSSFQNWSTAQINTIQATLTTLINWSALTTWITNWWYNTIHDVTGLIDSAFLTREGFWKGWQEVRDNVVGFISNPLDFLLDKFTDWFLGKE